LDYYVQPGTDDDSGHGFYDVWGMAEGIAKIRGRLSGR
jgi:hypothetical protein